MPEKWPLSGTSGSQPNSRKSPATRLKPEKGSEISLPPMTIFLDARKTAGPYDHFSPKIVGLGTENLGGEGPAVLLKRSLTGKIFGGICGCQKNGRFQAHLEASQIVENLPLPVWSQEKGQKSAFPI